MTGMPLFDSVCNTFGTIAAAGFSPHPQSIAGYQNPAAEWVIIVFMFLSGTNFALQYRALARRDWRVFGDDEELRAYAGVVVIATIVLAVDDSRPRSAAAICFARRCSRCCRSSRRPDSRASTSSSGTIRPRRCCSA